MGVLIVANAFPSDNLTQSLLLLGDYILLRCPLRNSSVGEDTTAWLRDRDYAILLKQTTEDIHFTSRS